MNAFPLLAVFTLCVSFAVLSASFNDLREAPLAHDPKAEPMRIFAALPSPPANPAPERSTVYEANEGLLDRELASADPIEAWLERYLTPPAN